MTFRKRPIVLAVLLLLLFTVSMPFIQVGYNLYYRVIFAACSIAAISQKQFINITFSIYSAPIIFCLAVFTAFWLIDYGDRSFNTLLSFVRGFAVFVLVFAVSRDIRIYQILSVAFLISILFLTEVMMVGGMLSLHTMDSRAEIVNAVVDNLNMDKGDSKRASNYMVVTVGYISFASVLGCSFLDYPSRYWTKLLVLIPFVLTFIFCLKSLWTAPVMILIFSLLLMRVLHLSFPFRENKGAKAHKQFVMTVIITVVIFTAMFLGIAIVLSGFQSGEAFVRSERLRSIFRFIGTFGDTPFDYNSTSSGRVELASRSIAGFLSSPIIGVGDTTDSEYISNHSSILDVLARFGLVGFIPFISMFGFYSHLSYRLVRMRVKKEHWTHISIMTFFLVYFLSNFGNPYILTSVVELLFFSSAGYVSGRYSYLTQGGRPLRKFARRAGSMPA